MWNRADDLVFIIIAMQIYSLRLYKMEQIKLADIIGKIITTLSAIGLEVINHRIV